MEYSHDFATHTGYVHDFGHSASTKVHQPDYHYDQAVMQDYSHDMYGMAAATLGHKMSCDVKPRLTKEQHDILEAHYQKQQKPNTSTKRSFAEALNVTLEKVNNWFQNRRAKSKQDAKKQQGSTGISNLPQQSLLSLNISDSETSPAFASTDYFQMMQQCDDDDDYDDELPSGHENVQRQQQQPQNHRHVDIANPQSFATETANFDMMHDLTQSIDYNRRTLTQEQFDAFAQQDIMLNSGDLAMLSADPEILSSFLVGHDHHHAEDQMLQPSVDQLAKNFPDAAMLQEHIISTPGSEWTDSRSSTASLPQSFEQHHISTPLGHPLQWQPGQSVPVNFAQLNQEFRKVAEAREVPGSWSVPEEGLARTDSSTSLITQSMGNVGLHTPQPAQQATFDAPLTVSSLAARRQRQRPTPLGLASLRSLSYSGTSPPSGSPGQMGPPTNTPGQLRRIKSSNVIGGIAQGRVHKHVAPPQRSPLNWSFTDAMRSPQATRHRSSQSTSALAPPTPLSPPDEALKAQQMWQNASKHITHQASISETDAEHAFGNAIAEENFSSPPHTPMLHAYHQFMPPQIIPGSMIMENTPPQSAPASQQCFPPNIYGPSPQMMHQFQQPMMQQTQQMQQVFMPQPQPSQHQVMHLLDQEQPYRVAQMPVAGQQFTVMTSGTSIDMPLQYAQNGMPIVDAQGQMSLAMPSQLQFIQQKSQRMPESRQSGQIPPGSQTTFSIANTEAAPLQVTAQVPKHSTTASSDFFVHEYTPPQDIKRIATPRKAVDSGPKNYTFSNHTPEHFEKGRKGSAKTSGGSSPDSALSA